MKGVMYGDYHDETGTHDIQGSGQFCCESPCYPYYKIKCYNILGPRGLDLPCI